MIAVLSKDNLRFEQHPAIWYMDKDAKQDNGAQVFGMRPAGLGAFRAAYAAHKINGIVVCSEEELAYAEKYFNFDGRIRTKATIKYGNLIGCSAVNRDGVRLVCLPTIPMIRASRSDKFIASRLLQKLTRPGGFAPKKYFHHAHISHEGQHDAEVLRTMLKGKLVGDAGYRFVPTLMSVDLETDEERACQIFGEDELRHYLGCIDLVGIGVYGHFEDISDGSYVRSEVFTFTWDYEHEWQDELTREVMASHVYKTFSNGMYDNQYLLRWDCPVWGYIHDTEYWLRAITPDLTGYYSLQSQATLYMLDASYWKDGRDAKSRKAYQEYCARDCHNTVLIAVAQMAALDKQQFRNFVIGMARTPFALQSSMTGMQGDVQAVNSERAAMKQELEQLDEEIRAITGYGANQSKELLPLFKGMADHAKALKIEDVPSIKSTDKNAIRDLSFVHPMYNDLLTMISEYRRIEKWLSTYVDIRWFTPRDNGELPSPTMPYYLLWTINPFGTKSGRLSSGGSAFWCGVSGHTNPRDLRHLWKAPEGKLFATSDAPQSESRVTAHEARCRSLKERTEGELDFHTLQASAFFGLEYNAITKAIRQLSKQTNHGANYNMGPFQMIITMGIANVRMAQELLHLPGGWRPIQVTSHLLKGFADTYPEVKNEWPEKLVIELLTTGRVHCQISGYAPIMLGSPLQYKPDLNSLISIVPQSTSAYISIKGTMALFSNWLYNGSGVMPVIQIHDENVTLIDINEDVQYVDALYNKCCRREYEVRWPAANDPNATETLCIPVGIPAFGTHWNQLKADGIQRDDRLKCREYLPQVKEA